MNVVTALAHGTSILSKSGIGTARLDTLVLLEDSLHRDKAWILSHPETKLSAVQLSSLQGKLKRRATHMPLAYVRGHTEFYGRRFKVNRHVLEPRPESETMIDLLKQIVDSRQETEDSSKNPSTVYRLPSTLSIADVGTGCGALGITVALEITDSVVDLYDISSSALGVAKHNGVLHELHLHARKMNLLARPLRPYDIILANLPYVPNDHKVNQAAAMEPKIAIFGGKDGLDIYRMFFEQLARHKHQPTHVLTESLPPQHKELAKIATAHGFKLHQTEDFIQVFTKNT